MNFELDKSKTLVCIIGWEFITDQCDLAVVTTGTEIFTGPENGWEIHWSLFKFPSHLHKGTM